LLLVRDLSDVGTGTETSELGAVLRTASSEREAWGVRFDFLADGAGASLVSVSPVSASERRFFDLVGSVTM
jgi:hypothetical protein